MRICRILVDFGIYHEYNKCMVKIYYEKIKNYLNNSGYSQNQFCELVGISKLELNKIINGEYDFKFSSLIKLANFFKIPLGLLIDFGETDVQTEFYL